MAWEEGIGNNEANAPEANDEPDVEDNRIWAEESIPIVNDNVEYEIDFGRGKRVRHRPNWMKDYILSLFRRGMARTKKTPRKQSHKCNAYGQCFGTKRESKYHMLTEHLGEVGCSVCLKSFSKKFYYEKHMKKLHAGEEKDLKIEKDTEETVKEQIEEKDLKRRFLRKGKSSQS